MPAGPRGLAVSGPRGQPGTRQRSPEERRGGVLWRGGGGNGGPGQSRAAEPGATLAPRLPGGAVTRRGLPRPLRPGDGFQAAGRRAAALPPPRSPPRAGEEPRRPPAAEVTPPLRAPLARSHSRRGYEKGELPTCPGFLRSGGRCRPLGKARRGGPWGDLKLLLPPRVPAHAWDLRPAGVPEN